MFITTLISSFKIFFKRAKELIDGEQMSASGGEGKLGGGGMEHKGKRTHGHRQQWGDCWGVGDPRGLNGNGEIS